VKQRVAVLVAVGGDPSAGAAKQATSTIPVVFGIGGDPVKAGLVRSLARPGGNATGYTLLSPLLEPKRLGMLHDLVPDASVIGVLVNIGFAPAEAQLTTLEKAAETLAQRIEIFKASNDTELAASLDLLGQRKVGALLVMASPYFDTRRDRIIAAAAQNKLPAIYQLREYAADGGLISYGPSITDAYRHGGAYAGQILKGAKPADLPVLQPTKFEFVVNLKTAKTLGLAIPAGLISFADEVIE
jgi:putative tryptophan/tyrosine transport system substrate-binding protein